MNYPTIEDVEKADRIQLARWYRFLPSPSLDEIVICGDMIVKKTDVLNRIIERFMGLGGMQTEISKEIGW